MKRTLTLLSAITLGALLIASSAMADGKAGVQKHVKHHSTKHHVAAKHTAKKATHKSAKKTGKMVKVTTKAKSAKAGKHSMKAKMGAKKASK
jgi:hypothetical protein